MRVRRSGVAEGHARDRGAASTEDGPGCESIPAIARASPRPKRARTAASFRARAPATRRGARPVVARRRHRSRGPTTDSPCGRSAAPCTGRVAIGAAAAATAAVARRRCLLCGRVSLPGCRRPRGRSAGAPGTAGQPSWRSSCSGPSLLCGSCLVARDGGGERRCREGLGTLRCRAAAPVCWSSPARGVYRPFQSVTSLPRLFPLAPPPIPSGLDPRPAVPWYPPALLLPLSKQGCTFEVPPR